MDYQIDVVQREEHQAAVVRGYSDSAHIAEFLGHAFRETATLVEREHLAYAGHPFGRYVPTGDGGFEVEAGFPVDGPATAKDDVEIVMVPGGPAVHTVHVGPYHQIISAYEATSAWARANHFAPVGPPIETYLDGPHVANPRTEVFIPVESM